jgi:small GTP-binding protein
VKRKIVLLGDSAVGKTSLVRRYVFDLYEDSYVTTIGSKVTRKELRIQRPDKTVTLTMMIWDILGREGYTSLHARTFAGVHGAILVSDLTRRETLRSLEEYWIPLLFKVVDKVPLVFVCNKTDKVDKFAFQPDQMVDIASRHNLGMEDVLPSGLAIQYATSAKTGENVERAFESLGHLVLTGRTPKEPVKELYENMMALGTKRRADYSTLIGALDEIIVDFCENLNDERSAMSIVTGELVRAGVDVRKPSREGLLRAVEYLAEAESAFRDPEAVVESREKRLQWVIRVKES